MGNLLFSKNDRGHLFSDFGVRGRDSGAERPAEACPILLKEVCLLLRCIGVSAKFLTAPSCHITFFRDCALRSSNSNKADGIRLLLRYSQLYFFWNHTIWTEKH